MDIFKKYFSTITKQNLDSEYELKYLYDEETIEDINIKENYPIVMTNDNFSCIKLENDKILLPLKTEYDDIGIFYKNNDKLVIISIEPLSMKVFENLCANLNCNMAKCSSVSTGRIDIYEILLMLELLINDDSCKEMMKFALIPYEEKKHHIDNYKLRILNN